MYTPSRGCSPGGRTLICCASPAPTPSAARSSEDIISECPSFSVLLLIAIEDRRESQAWLGCVPDGRVFMLLNCFGLLIQLESTDFYTSGKQNLKTNSEQTVSRISVSQSRCLLVTTLGNYYKTQQNKKLVSPIGLSRDSEKGSKGPIYWTEKTMCTIARVSCYIVRCAYLICGYALLGAQCPSPWRFLFGSATRINRAAMHVAMQLCTCT